MLSQIARPRKFDRQRWPEGAIRRHAASAVVAALQPVKLRQPSAKGVQRLAGPSSMSSAPSGCADRSAVNRRSCVAGSPQGFRSSAVVPKPSPRSAMVTRWRSSPRRSAICSVDRWGASSTRRKTAPRVVVSGGRYPGWPVKAAGSRLGQACCPITIPRVSAQGVMRAPLRAPVARGRRLSLPLGTPKNLPQVFWFSPLRRVVRAQRLLSPHPSAFFDLGRPWTV